MRIPASHPKMIDDLGWRDCSIPRVPFRVKESGDYYFISLGKRVFELLLEEFYL
jgi:hypothetical protein